MIQYLVFDVDNTLLDFNMSLYRTEKLVADALGIEMTEPYISGEYDALMRSWRESGMLDTADPELRKVWHDKYRKYIIQHFEELAAERGMDLDPLELRPVFFEGLSQMHHMMEKETLEVYAELSKKYKNVIATNCPREIRDRINPFLPYTYKVFISDELNIIKPDPAFFKGVTDGLLCDSSVCLMIGDSKTDDMEGAKMAGFQTCWYRRGRGDEQCGSADYAIDSITDLPGLLERI